MAYVLTDGSTSVVTYPYNIGMLRRDNPNVSFPASPTVETLAEWNVFEVQSTAEPSYDVYTQEVAEASPTTSDGGLTWAQAWDVIDLTVEQQAVKLQQFEEAAAQTSGSLLDQADQFIVTALVRGKALSEEFATYRQSLVDYQSLPGYPAATQWPTLPSTIIVDVGIAPIAYPPAGAAYTVSDGTTAGTLAFNNENLQDVTSITLNKITANDYDITTALTELKENGNELVINIANAKDSSKKVSFKVTEVTDNAAGSVAYEYRGFKAVYARTWNGGDPSISNIIFYKSTVTDELINPIDNDTDSEEFGLTNLSNGDTYAILNIYGSSSAGTPASEIKNAALAFIDNVIYTGSDLSTAEQANNNFYASYSTIASTITSGLYSGMSDVYLSGNSIDDGGDDQYDTGNFINTNYESGINYGNGEVVSDSTAFGPDSQYVSMYQDSLFAMFITNSDITEFGIDGNKGADGDGNEEHARVEFDSTPPSEEELANAPFYLTCSYLEGSASFDQNASQIVTIDYGNVSKPEKVWVTPNNTTWKIVEVSGGKRVTYAPSNQISNNNYNYLGTSPVNNVDNLTNAVGTETDVYFINVEPGVINWLNDVDITNQELLINGTVVATMNGSYGGGGGGSTMIYLPTPVTYANGDSVLIRGVQYQTTNSVQIPDDGSINPATIIPYKSTIEFNGQTRLVTSVSQGDWGLGSAFYIYFDGQGFKFNQNNSVSLSLWTPEVAAKWLDPQVDFGISPEELRGFTLDYHLYSEDAGTIIGKFIAAIDDNPRVSHTFTASGGGDLSAIDLETYSNDWYDDKSFLFKRTDGEDDTIMIQWSGKAFYSPEWRD